MKLLYIISICFIFLTSCDLNDDNETTYEETTYLVEWHLIEVNGGISGETDEFDLNTVVWTFNTENNVLTVVNNNTDDTKEDALDSGTYSYSETDFGGIFYLSIDGDEFGEFSFSSSNNFLTINATELSTEMVSDGYIYEFQRVLVEVE
ncbi:hypothetical protein [Seonamhaeicola sp.]|uniref:hypothetical protein n=1 Tax=Seonamhaeicola sp. TaxID=1912245 RepID=UPI003565D878